MLLHDTIYYRADGTISSIQRVTRETFTKPSGAQASEDLTSEVSLDTLRQHLGEAYANMDAHNRNLEAQIERERQAAAQALTSLEASAAAQIAARAREIENLQATVQQLVQRASLAEGKLAALADLDRQYDQMAAQLRAAAPEQPAA